MDLSNSMGAIAKAVFPYATVIRCLEDNYGED